jgi:metal-responsive CopG/Arc/MetJ family transcriptional regulator
MSVAKVAISLDQQLLQKLDSLVRGNAFKSRSELIQVALVEKLSRIERSRLAQECSKLSALEEQEQADEGLRTDLAEWPEY